MGQELYKGPNLGLLPYEKLKTKAHHTLSYMVLFQPFKALKQGYHDPWMPSQQNYFNFRLPCHLNTRLENPANFRQNVSKHKITLSTTETAIYLNIQPFWKNNA